MKPTKKLILMLITFLLGASLILGGCSTTAKKPIQDNTTTRNKTNVTTPGANNYKQVANRVANAAEKVNGVRQATAVVSGKMIYIGLDLVANLEKMTAADVEQNVLNKIKKMEPNYTVYVASDPDTVTRIKRISQGIAQGKPLSSFKNELDNIGSRLKPRAK